MSGRASIARLQASPSSSKSGSDASFLLLLLPRVWFRESFVEGFPLWRTPMLGLDLSVFLIYFFNLISFRCVLFHQLEMAGVHLCSI